MNRKIYIPILIVIFSAAIFYSYEGFSDIYDDRLFPKIEITALEDDISYVELDKSWSYQRINRRWTEEVNFPNTENVPGSTGVEDVLDVAPVFSYNKSIEVSADKVPDRSVLIIREQTTETVKFQDIVNIQELPHPEMNGVFEYILTMEWTDETKQYRGQKTISFPIVLDFPENYQFSREEIIQGDILEITVYYAGNPQDVFVEQSIFEEFRWFSQEGLLRGYIPTNYSTEPGVYQIRYGSKSAGTEYVKDIEVIAHEYRVQNLYIDENIEQQTRNEKAYAEFAKYFNPVRLQSAPVRYYTDSFIIPSKGRLTTEFGQTRYVNDAPTSYRHSGLDIAAPTGTDILATNSGKVVLAMPLILTGNTIVIDHGEGLFSVYFHNHENFVEVGEMVERGQLIGSVGTTGFSTGPHLHFTMSYYNMNLEPGFFLVGQPITFANHREFLQ
ncbi:M23 family metallopeptidase [Desulfuribacillus alkaliarsenatis]|uniref:M23ase beta-sheet core domain-containing protein n=1 Tax=Desulfuribacillus alkaliarsenatis TaxID=766136 RepID=A0A1E5G2A7_9FIRM|nr:M23 family metallopeptidase [Desulfuribacillus alkaliarsenatis]OEF97096.1 hypothetical protein BHF68_05720 [Desulfuribacillus alkaliarsenatis]